MAYMVMTYNSLVTQIQTYSYRTDKQFLDSIPYFIQNAHSRIYRDAKDLGEQRIVNDKFTLQDPIVIKPADWWQTVSFGYGIVGNPNAAYNMLLLRSFEFCRAYWPNASGTFGAPLFYSDSPDLNPNSTPINSYKAFYLSPTPDQVYQYQLVYLAQPVVITKDNQTNWLTQYAPDLLFYACMCDAMPFLKDDERSAAWQPMYDKALQSVNNYTKERYIDRIYKRDKV